MSKAPLKILVTGASGTVGTALLAEIGHLDPRLAFHSAVKASKGRAAGHDTVVLDFARPETLRPAMAGVDALFLLGAGGPGFGQEEGEIAVVNAAVAGGVQKIVKLSAWGAEKEGISIEKMHRTVER